MLVIAIINSILNVVHIINDYVFFYLKGEIQMIYDEEAYISEEQQHDFDLLVRLSNEIEKQINVNRSAAIEMLLDESVTVMKKKSVLKDFIKTRIDFESQILKLDGIEYSYKEFLQLAKKLFDDSSFLGNDSPYVMNGLAFYENSIAFEDVILAFHNYRLGHEEGDLWWLSLILCTYIYNVLSMNTIYKSVSYNVEEMYVELGKLSEYVIDFWNKYLKDAETYQSSTNSEFCASREKCNYTKK